MDFEVIKIYNIDYKFFAGCLLLINISGFIITSLITYYYIITQ